MERLNGIIQSLIMLGQILARAQRFVQKLIFLKYKKKAELRQITPVHSYQNANFYLIELHTQYPQSLRFIFDDVLFQRSTS